MAWRNRLTDDLVTGTNVSISPEDGDQWTVRISQPADTAVSVTLSADPETMA